MANRNKQQKKQVSKIKKVPKTEERYTIEQYSEHRLYDPKFKDSLATILNQEWAKGRKMVKTFSEMGECTVLYEKIDKK